MSQIRKYTSKLLETSFFIKDLYSQYMKERVDVSRYPELDFYLLKEDKQGLAYSKGGRYSSQSVHFHKVHATCPSNRMQIVWWICLPLIQLFFRSYLFTYGKITRKASNKAWTNEMCWERLQWLRVLPAFTTALSQFPASILGRSQPSVTLLQQIYCLWMDTGNKQHIHTDMNFKNI